MMRATWLLIRFSAFRFCNLLDCAFFNARVTARGGCAALALEGWTPPPGALGLPPASYKTGAKNIYDQKIPKVQGFAITLLSKASQDYSIFSSEITMAKVNLSGMGVEALVDLRKRVDEMLHKRRAELEKQLESMAVVGGRRVVRGGGSVLKGRRVPPKYRGPSGETWAGRGAKPKWLVAAIKGGKKLADFLIDKPARKGRKKRRSKR